MAVLKESVAERNDSRFSIVTFVVFERISSDGRGRLDKAQEISDSIRYVRIGSFGIDSSGRIILREAEEMNIWVATVVETDEHLSGTLKSSVSISYEHLRIQTHQGSDDP